MKEPNYELLIQATEDCARACEACISSAQAGGASSEGMRVAMDCAEFCRLLTSFSKRRSPFVSSLARDLAAVCAACANECQKEQSDAFRACVETSQGCANACVRATAGV